jgi:3-hydroxyanthranilate 3,4-dioxygenase
MYSLNAIPFRRWIDEHRHLLKPPVGNKLVFEDAEFMIMVVGGPNARKDYHVNDGEEFFYQIEGDIVLKIMDGGVSRDVDIREGDIFLLPARTPHSPQRGPDTVGLVIERRRKPEELDGFLWFCEQCGTQLHEERVAVANIVTQLPPLMAGFWASIEKRTCRSCGAVMDTPAPRA